MFWFHSVSSMVHIPDMVFWYGIPYWLYHVSMLKISTWYLFLCVPYGYYSEQIELISFSTLQLENDIPTLSVSQVSSPTIIVERAGSYAWTHKNWRVREEFVHTVAAAVGLFASTELPLQRVLLSPACKDDFIFCYRKLFPFSLFHSC